MKVIEIVQKEFDKRGVVSLMRQKYAGHTVEIKIFAKAKGE